MEVRARAPGKIIVAGEHAVVHGSAAVAASIDLYTYVSLRFPTPADNDETLSLQLKDVSLEFSWPIARIKEAFPNLENPILPSSCSLETLKLIASLVDEQNIPEANIGLAAGVTAFLWLFTSIHGCKPAKAVVNSELPLGSGLGSSAAFCVALSAAILALSDSVTMDFSHQGWQVFGENELELVNKWAFEGEKIIHGKPSGIDNTVSTYGRRELFSLLLLQFYRLNFTYMSCLYLVHKTYNEVLDPLENLNLLFMKRFDTLLLLCGIFFGTRGLYSHLPFCSSYYHQGNMIKFKSGDLTRLKTNMPLKMLITNTKVGRNTKALVASVSERTLRHPTAMASVFTAVDSISNEVAAIIQSPVSDDLAITEKEEKLAELMEMNQGLLQCMGVSHASIETILRTTLKYKLSTKLTGAGGGGCVLTLLPTLLSGTVVDKVIADLETCGFQCLLAGIGGNGVEFSYSGIPDVGANGGNLS